MGKACPRREYQGGVIPGQLASASRCRRLHLTDGNRIQLLSTDVAHLNLAAGQIITLGTFDIEGDQLRQLTRLLGLLDFTPMIVVLYVSVRGHVEKVALHWTPVCREPRSVTAVASTQDCLLL